MKVVIIYAEFRFIWVMRDIEKTNTHTHTHTEGICRTRSPIEMAKEYRDIIIIEMVKGK